MVSADLIGYNRGVNNNFQHKSMQLKRQNLDRLGEYRLGAEGHYRTTMIMYLLQNKNVRGARQLLGSLSDKVKKTNGPKRTARTMRSAYNKFHRMRMTKEMK